MVGCVIVKDGRVIGEGWHEQFGGPHAEPNALASCTESPEGATVYVTLEPCCHTNKKTPPCTPRLIEAKVARVVIGCLDPNPEVNGKGVAMLREAGIRVDPAPKEIEAEARQLIAAFIKYTRDLQPYVTLKWAETADGKVAGKGGERIAITGPIANRRVHELRSRSDYIVVGINTVLNDDPRLTVRGVPRFRGSVPVVLDTHLRIPDTSQLVKMSEERLIVFCAESVPEKPAKYLEFEGVGIRRVPLDSQGHVSLKAVLNDLRWDQGMHVMVEPGPTLAASFLRQGMLDRVWVFRSKTRLDQPDAPRAQPVPAQFVKTGELRLGDDLLTEYLNPYSSAYFASVPSADFALAREEVEGR
jgi:diaminohydroxyphosphoribosylaminopyrimidine deaminase/5-amino-6-(5-phosphoribosylamino)uracil reductase